MQLNEAWRTLKDPVRRAEYLLTRAGIDIGDKQPTPGGDEKRTMEVAAPPAFLMEILELRDELAAAQRAGDTVKVAFMAEEMRGRRARDDEDDRRGAGQRACARSSRRRRARWSRCATTSASSTRRRRHDERSCEGGPGPADGPGRTMAEALFQIAEPGESRGQARLPDARGRDRPRDHELAGRVVDAGEPTALADEQGDAIVPSVVHYAGDGGVVVGADARDGWRPSSRATRSRR